MLDQTYSPGQADNALETRQRLGDLLVSEGLITAGQLSEILTSRIEFNGRMERMGETAIRLGICTPDTIGMVLAQQLGLEYLDGQLLVVDPNLARRMPPHMAERHLVIPLTRHNDTVTIACVDPTDIVALDDVRVALGARHLSVAVAPVYLVQQALMAYFGDSQAEGLVEELEEREDDAEELQIDPSQDGPIIRLADEILGSAVRGKASDVHVEPKEDCCIVRHRIDGVLHVIMTLPRSVSSPLVSRIKLIAGLDIAEKRKPQDGRSHYRGNPNRPEEAVDLRVSTLPSMFGESVVLRLLRREGAMQELHEVGLDEVQSAQVLSVIERPQGLVLVTGPTGSGKTSTLYTLLTHLATTERKLITVEDPVEYELPGIVQTQVHERAGYDLPRAMRAILRQDPDIVMVGEIRDPETAELALQASLTGHLVLSTLHTNDAASAVVRMAELGMPNYLIASALTLVVAQRLGRVVCPDCGAPTPVNERQRQRLGLRSDSGTYLEGTGCPFCNHTGYRGRTGLFEILTVDGQVRELIADGASTAAISLAARKVGLRSIREDALRKASGGVISLEEVLRVTPSVEHSSDHCPVCAKQVEGDYAACPWCATDLRPLECRKCERALDVAWMACPGCGTPTSAGPESSDGNPPRVLIVDDDESVRAALSAMLLGDFDVVTAATGEEALAAIHTSRFDAVLLDKGLPDMDGYAVTQEIRARPTVRDVPVMIVTGWDDPEVELQGLRAGADDWIAKPVDMDVLLARLFRLVQRRATAAV